MSVQPVLSRRNLHDDLIMLLRSMIIDGELRPGTRIPEQQLCTRFGVSRTPFREALMVLSAEGLVSLLPSRGASVIRVTREEADGIIPMLGALQALAGELACARIDDAGIARIRGTHRQMVKCYRRGDAEGYIVLNRAIHQAILEASTSKVLTENCNMLEMRLKSLLFVASRAPPDWSAAVDDHERMVKALEARDGAEFARVARGHIRHKAEVVRNALDLLDARTDATKSCSTIQPMPVSAPAKPSGSGYVR